MKTVVMCLTIIVVALLVWCYQLNDSIINLSKASKNNSEAIIKNSQSIIALSQNNIENSSYARDTTMKYLSFSQNAMILDMRLRELEDKINKQLSYK